MVSRDPETAIVLMSAAGKLFRQETARRYAKLSRVIFICGRYEGVDERVAEHLATEEDFRWGFCFERRGVAGGDDIGCGDAVVAGGAGE